MLLQSRGGVSALFGSLGVVLEQQAEGGKAEQEGLDKPQESNPRVADSFVAMWKQKRVCGDLLCSRDRMTGGGLIK